MGGLLSRTSFGTHVDYRDGVVGMPSPGLASVVEDDGEFVSLHDLRRQVGRHGEDELLPCVEPDSGLIGFPRLNRCSVG